MSGAIDRAIDTAKRLIERYGETCSWQKKTNGTPADAAKPWKAGASRNSYFDCKIVFLRSDKLNLKAVVKALKGTTDENAQGYQRGLLAGDCGFVPSVNDTIIRGDGSTSVLMSIDKLAPNGLTVFYELGVSP